MKKMWEYVKSKIFNKSVPEIKGIYTTKWCNNIIILFESSIRCSIYGELVNIHFIGSRNECNYLYKNNKLFVRELAINRDFSEKYKTDNPKMFDIIIHILQNTKKVFEIVEKANYLQSHTNYFENLPQARTFLLCNFRNRIFYRDIENIIVQKILFASDASHPRCPELVP